MRRKEKRAANKERGTSDALSRREVLGGAFGLAATAMTTTSTRKALAQSSGPTEVMFASPRFFDREAIEGLLDRYNSSQTSVRAVFHELPNAADSGAVHDELKRLLKDPATSPGVFALDIVRIAEFAAEGLSLPLGDFFNPADLAGFFPGIINGCRLSGELVALPWFADSGMLFYRTDLLEQLGADVPRTWDGLVDTAKRATSDTVPYGFLWQGRKSEALVCNAVSVIGSNGGAILGADGRSVGIANSEAVEAIGFFRDTFSKHGISPKDVLDWDEEPCRKPFNDGKAVFLRNWGYTWDLAHRPDGPVAGRIGVAPLPSFPGKSSAACLGGYQFAVSANTPERMAAIDLLYWLSSAETQLFFARSHGLAPTRPAVFDKPELAETQTFLPKVKDVFAGAIARPVAPNYQEISLIIQDRISKALSSGDIDAELSLAQAEIEAVIAG